MAHVPTIAACQCAHGDGEQRFGRTNTAGYILLLERLVMPDFDAIIIGIGITVTVYKVAPARP
jgi:hypothetical protein